ncbi:glutamyl-tRNA reductase [Clostridium beijerinckii]|uniref:Glutamyl-tRNA reductase n=1 Tax=Clostridium beijerinckii TaxID=1520 RepID=A0A9Q5CFG4_CLOBE|nr:glutamyl-tRNA reductase [Clostridium beijerinckii]AQS03932.1 glutamyl-tRNA reductase [Clostridium beijerinckii]MBA2885258.1 glutamyl-tRNA reductase [Clostridium beijerinckii]MBA2899794.1 glutamyl-tRNA reductase [Clostridium beijerinckii]MBA2909609.1 glutamyl-tRNA reductase [Clostridium beijerinckii]MBA9016522.1 glutamyl-tRNA reductase [Clostridium beijerinckii]
MIGLIGIRKNTPLEIREKFIVKSKKYNEYFGELLKELNEVVILATCNRTEIYFNASLNEEELLKKIFDIFNWDYEYKKYVFITNNKDAYRHLFEVCSGFHSKILGEDQILGQVKDAYEEALEFKAVSLELHRLFQEAITCGKRFRKEAKLFEIPVSSSSIVVSEAIKRECTKFMVLGYGEVGQLVMKYLLSHKIQTVYLVVRNPKIKDEIQDERVKVITFEEKNKYINSIECIVSCTSAPHPVVKTEDISESGSRLVIYDLSVPRDVEKEVALLSRTEVYNIDTISRIDDENKKLRKDKMEENRHIMNKYLKEYDEWLKLRSISHVIKNLKTVGNDVYEKRVQTFSHKSKDKNDIALAHKLIKSTSDFYINRAIEVIKEETLKGCGEEWIGIIEKIFMTKE